MVRVSPRRSDRMLRQHIKKRLTAADPDEVLQFPVMDVVDE